MALKYKINVLNELKKAGYSTYRLKKEHILAESTIQKFRSGIMVSIDNINRICELLNLQPGDILEYIPDQKDGQDS